MYGYDIGYDATFLKESSKKVWIRWSSLYISFYYHILLFLVETIQTIMWVIVYLPFLRNHFRKYMD